MIQAVIFDMDGLLIDSEPFWQNAEMEVFATVGMHLTREMCYQTMGLRIDDVVKYWYAKFPWQGKPLKQVESEIIDAVIRQIKQEGKLMEGVKDVIDFLKSKGMRLALASSSAYRIINAVVETFGLDAYLEFVYSAEEEVYGKPHPAVYLTAAAKLGLEPVDCMAFEDSVTGLIAAKAARIKTVAVPDKHEFAKTKYDFADLKLPSLLAFGEPEWQLINS